MRKRFQLRLVNARFLFFSRQIDLKADVQWRAVVWPLIVETGGDLETIDGVSPVKISSDIPRLIRLNPADKVPGDIERLQFLQLAGGLLNDIFSKIANSGVVGRSYGANALPLAYGQNSDVRIPEISAELRIPDAFAYFCNVVRDLSHALT